MSYIFIPLCLVLAGCFLYEESRKNYVPAVILKGVASFCFVVLGYRLMGTSREAGLICAGLLLGCIADVLLNLRFVFPSKGQPVFLVGILVFLAGHVLYLVAVMGMAASPWLCVGIGVVLTALLMFISPTKRIPKPIRMEPALAAPLFFFPRNMIRIMPTIRAKGARLSDLKKYRMLLFPASTSIRRMICAVMAVPTLAPRTIPTDCRKVRNPAPTRPTVSTMVAVELWIMQVTSTPRIKPMTGLLVTLARAAFMAPPELLFSPSPIMRIPYRNIASPPKRDTIR